MLAEPKWLPTVFNPQVSHIIYDEIIDLHTSEITFSTGKKV